MNMTNSNEVGNKVAIEGISGGYDDDTSEIEDVSNNKSIYIYTLRHKTRLHIGQLVKDTSPKLKQASEIDHRAEVSASKKVTDAKLAKDFQAVLKEFRKAQRLTIKRETTYTPFVPQTVLPSSYTAGEVDVGSDKSAEQRALLVESRR
ncbi:Syntaxin-22 [Hibiscus syriacus]|uniref:Syntaxin-22 n=1 Tax=Hibiscus syriacus TaxID=106335 RepID=A0A6A3A7T0_HIBSY|nr:Syntaxin-22 [Hibiscus syriacus]